MRLGAANAITLTVSISASAVSRTVTNSVKPQLTVQVRYHRVSVPVIRTTLTAVTTDPTPHPTSPRAVRIMFCTRMARDETVAYTAGLIKPSRPLSVADALNTAAVTASLFTAGHTCSFGGLNHHRAHHHNRLLRSHPLPRHHRSRLHPRQLGHPRN